MMRDDHKNFAVEQELSHVTAIVSSMGLHVERRGNLLWLPMTARLDKSKLKKIGFYYLVQQQSWVYESREVTFKKSNRGVAYAVLSKLLLIVGSGLQGLIKLTRFTLLCAGLIFFGAISIGLR